MRADIHSSIHKNNTATMMTASSPKLNNSSLTAARVEAAKEDTNSRTLAMLRDLSSSPLSATSSRGGGSQLMSPLSANTQPTSPASVNSSQSRAQISTRGMSGKLSNTSYFTANRQQPLNLSGDYLSSPMSMNSRGSTVAEAAFAAATVHDQNARTLALLRAMSGDLSTANSTLSMNSRDPVADAAFAATASYDRDAKTLARLRAMSGELSTANSMCSDSLSESSLKDAMALGRLYQSKTTTTSPLGSMISHEKKQQIVVHEAAHRKAPTTSPPTGPVPQQPLVEAARRKVAFVERNPTPISRAPSAESEWTKDSKQNDDGKTKASTTNERNIDNTRTGTPNSIMKKTSSPNPHHPIKVPVKTSSSETETLGTQTIVDDESESSLLVLIRYMGCSPNRYGSGGPSLRSRAMSDQLDKEYTFESYSVQEFDSMLSDAADYSSEIEDIEQSWTLLNDEVGVEINLMDVVLPSPVSTDENRKEETEVSELNARATSPKMKSAAAQRIEVIAGIPAERLEMSAADLILEAMSSTVTNEADLRTLSILSDVASQQASKVATRATRTARKTILTVDTGEEAPLRPSTIAGLAALGKYEEAVMSPSKKKSKAKSHVGEMKKKTRKKKSIAIASPKLVLSDSTSELLDSADSVIKDRIAKTMANVAALRKLDGDVISAREASELSEPTILISPITKSLKKAELSEPKILTSPITKSSKPKKKKSSSPTQAKRNVSCSTDKEESISTGIKKEISIAKTESAVAIQTIESRTESPPLASLAIETEDFREVDEFLSSTRDWIASNAQQRNLALQSPTQSDGRLTPKSFARKIVSGALTENSATLSPTNAGPSGRKNILEQLEEIRMKQRELEARQATKLNM